ISFLFMLIIVFFFFYLFVFFFFFFFFSSRRRHTRSDRDWSSDVCSSDLISLPRPKLRGDTSELGTRQRNTPTTASHSCLLLGPRSEERRVGKECRSRW